MWHRVNRAWLGRNRKGKTPENFVFNCTELTNFLPVFSNMQRFFLQQPVIYFLQNILKIFFLNTTLRLARRKIIVFFLFNTTPDQTTIVSC